ncbi:MAG TPA: transglutaminase domain-containing protein [Planctomycetaceae bacterium]|nr:transglutaminase domain-containing protein [Planctomycetaceae bacterium]
MLSLFRPWRGLLAVLAFCVSACAAEPDLPIPEAEESWQVIYLGGQRVGYARILVDPRKVGDETVVHTTAETRLVLKRFGQTLQMSTSIESEESLAGDLRKFTFSMANPPAMSTKTTGQVEAGKLNLLSEINGLSKTSSQPWQAGIKSPTYQDRLLRVTPLKSGETKSVQAFFPEMGKPGTLKVSAFDPETVTLLDGKTADLQLVKVSNSLVPGVTTKGWINARGDTVKSLTSLLGTEMVTYTVSKDEALKQLTVAELDLGVATLVKVRDIPDPYATKSVVYRLTIPDEDPSQIIPSGDTQSVKKISDHVCELTVTALPLPMMSTIGKAADEFLKPTPYLQSDDARVQKHAETAAGQLTDPAAIARAMESYVQKRLDKKNFSTALASAAEVAQKLEGDCTEHAVLLAAMLRVKQIPSRVAVGMVYISNPSAFGGHMWTEALLDGKWVPLDATLGRGGTGATHIKLGDATFADESASPISAFTSLITVIGKLQIEMLRVE